MIHVDMYRLLDHTDHQGADLLGELDSLDLDSDLDDAVVVVEWGEGKAEQLSEDYLTVHLERHIDDDVRIAELEPVGAGWSARLERMPELIDRR